MLHGRRSAALPFLRSTPPLVHPYPRAQSSLAGKLPASRCSSHLPVCSHNSKARQLGVPQMRERSFALNRNAPIRLREVASKVSSAPSAPPPKLKQDALGHSEW